MTTTRDFVESLCNDCCELVLRSCTALSSSSARCSLHSAKEHRQQHKIMNIKQSMFDVQRSKKACVFPYSHSLHSRRFPHSEYLLLLFSPNFQTDILLCLLMSMITLGLVAVVVTGMFYLTESNSIFMGGRVSRYWIETFTGVFLGIVVK